MALRRSIELRESKIEIEKNLSPEKKIKEISNFDKKNVDNPQEVAIYCNDIFKHLCQKS